MTISPLHISFKQDDLVFHRKSKGYYRILRFARVEATLEYVVVYEEVTKAGHQLHNAAVWTRPLNQFCDGRFQWVQG
jgi:hypothetical protein